MTLRGQASEQHGPIEAAPIQLRTLQKRAEFLRLRGGARWVTPAFILETKPREIAVDSKTATARFGFTVTKKLGGAVVRNRIRRRLKEAVRLSAGPFCSSTHDYVLIAREGALKRRFADLQGDVRLALQRVHASGAPREPGRGSHRQRDAKRMERAVEERSAAPESSPVSPHKPGARGSD